MLCSSKFQNDEVHQRFETSPLGQIDFFVYIPAFLERFNRDLDIKEEGHTHFQASGLLSVAYSVCTPCILTRNFTNLTEATS